MLNRTLNNLGRPITCLTLLFYRGDEEEGLLRKKIPINHRSHATKPVMINASLLSRTGGWGHTLTRHLGTLSSLV